MRDTAQALQANLRGGAFYGVNRAEQAIDLFPIVVAFQRNQAVTDNLQVFFGFGLKEFENLVGHFVIGRQSVKIGPGGGLFEGLLGVLLKSLLSNALLAVVKGRGLNGKSEAVAFF